MNGAHRQPVEEPDRESLFGKIYNDGDWGRTIRSGAGSDPIAARPYVAFVNQVIEKLDVRSVLDIGHGDWSIWPSDAFRNVAYLGVDVARGLSAEMQHLSNKSRHFRQLDAVSEGLPSADLVLCKDVLQHLSDHDVQKILRKFTKFGHVIICHDVATASPARASFLRPQLTLRSRAKLLLEGKYPFVAFGVSENSDCVTGGYRPLNLERRPWDLESLGLRLEESFDFPGERNRGASLVKRVWRFSTTAAARVRID